MPIKILKGHNAVKMTDHEIIINMSDLCSKCDVMQSVIKRVGMKVIVECHGHEVILEEINRRDGPVADVIIDYYARIDEDSNSVIIPITSYEV